MSQVLPEWRMMDQYVLLLQGVFQNDAVLSVNPMTYAVYTPSQVIGTFNAVAYQKCKLLFYVYNNRDRHRHIGT